MTPDTDEATDDPIIYEVMILSGKYCIPLYPYVGKDKEIAIAITTAHIAKGTPVAINETKASELRARFSTAKTKKKENSNDTQTNQNNVSG